MPPLPTDTAYSAVDFIETYTGRPFYPLRPRPADVSIIDIAHALGAQSRYSGHTNRFYPTAHHCCLLYDYVMQNGGSPVDGYQILLHDAAEAYLVDIPRPVKQYMPEYRQWDHDLTMCIRHWAGLGKVPIPAWQDELDSRIIVDERSQLFGDSGLDWAHNGKPLEVVIERWDPSEAEQQFLMRYAYVAGKLFGGTQYLRSGWGAKIKADHKPASYRTLGTDIVRYSPNIIDPSVVVDCIEVDIRGGVARVAMRSPDGMMERDTSVGKMPAPAWRWMHGDFTLTEVGK